MCMCVCVCVRVRVRARACVVDTDWADIAFHYLLDSEGFVYEARDPHAIPAAVRGYTHLYTPRVCGAKIKVR